MEATHRDLPGRIKAGTEADFTNRATSYGDGRSPYRPYGLVIPSGSITARIAASWGLPI